VLGSGKLNPVDKSRPSWQFDTAHRGVLAAQVDLIGTRRRVPRAINEGVIRTVRLLCLLPDLESRFEEFLAWLENKVAPAGRPTPMTSGIVGGCRGTGRGGQGIDPAAVSLAVVVQEMTREYGIPLCRVPMWLPAGSPALATAVALGIATWRKRHRPDDRGSIASQP
jgi:hypothetical protein